MNYKETIEWLFSQLPMYQRVGKAAYKSDLQTTIDLLNALENPQKSFKAIHIAGTNGKGSVSHLTASILQEAGIKTGLYTSPHLKDFRERIRINGHIINQEAVVEFVSSNKELLNKIKPSFFEMTVAMAYSYFRNEGVEIAVLETGMGGRLDSTNVCNPLITAITNIGLDHMQFLGDSIEKIAAEKAGIIKPSVDLIVGRKQKQTNEVFETFANKNSSRIIYAEDEFDIRRLNTADKSNVKLDIWLNNNPFLEQVSCPLSADYQIENIQTALSIVNKLIDQGFEISKENISDGLMNIVNNTQLLGRWQKIEEHPLTICDTGHNIDGIKEVVNQIRQCNFEKLHFVFGMVDDKNAEAIFLLLPKNAIYYFCKPHIPRGRDADSLSEEAFKFGLGGKVYSSVREAYYSAKNNAATNDMIFIGGSTFVVAEII